ncbi:phage tail protein [Tenacibaculum sp. SZ-18]|uniref:phage tail protein n=1 Tax=Tenacibaculum sp. SZ-18 TaxID=754423 RepID=UPI000C2D5D36|nr:tail fiber protein [Tenacibaculum sp. SZ-18]
MNSIKKIIGLLFVCFFLSNAEVKAQEGFIGEIRMFAGNFAPRNWAFCDGQLLAINSNTALFSILGTQYGGDGRTTFALPDLRGRVAISAGRGPGLQDYRQGPGSGAEFRTLTQAQMPSHTHAASFNGTGSNASIAIPTYADEANETEPSNQSTLAIGNFQGDETQMYTTQTPDGTLKPFSAPVTVGGTVIVGQAGASQSFDNRQPYTVVRYIICLQGLYPSRN